MGKAKTANTEKAESNLKRLIGTVAPISALRGKESAGCGEFPDLVDFAKFAKSCGLGLVQLLPVNDTAYESSPYSAVTAFALNPLYIRIGDIPESKGFEKKIKTIRNNHEKNIRFNYYYLAKDKMDLLKEIFIAAKSTISAESAKKTSAFGKWLHANSWVKAYSAFRVLKDENELRSWKTWKKYSKVNAADIEKIYASSEYAEDCLFYTWLQFHADSQFSAASAQIAEMGIILEGDIPILMGEDSADVWSEGQLFDDTLSAGAPPDMYSPTGQRWGFPIYKWKVHEKSGFAWWKQRLALAARYYGAYRIDHVLGFFRIYATSSNDNSALLGRFIPGEAITTAELKALGFDEGRIRWLSQPHIFSGDLINAAGNDGAAEAFEKALDRVGTENIWLFKKSIKGEKDIAALSINDNAKHFLTNVWGDRFLIEYSPGLFAPAWTGKDGKAYKSLDENEKNKIKELVEKKSALEQEVWEKDGTRLLSVLLENSKRADGSLMLPCAEDLGAVPDCVPKVLKNLGILGLNVVRWSRVWEENGSPYIPLSDYRELSVCTPAVHDSSTLRQWWETEADQSHLSAFAGVPALPKVYSPGVARTLLKYFASAASTFRVFQIQDLMHLSPKWYAEDSNAERINVPGTYDEFNWTWRLPAPLEEIASDKSLVSSIKELANVEPIKARAS